MNTQTHNKHHASREWLHERIAAVISIPLLIWLITSLVRFGCGCYGTLADFLSRPLNTALLIIFIGSFMHYTTLAMKVVFEDYVSNIPVRNFIIKFICVAGIAGFVLGVVAVLKISNFI